MRIRKRKADVNNVFTQVICESGTTGRAMYTYSWHPPWSYKHNKCAVRTLHAGHLMVAGLLSSRNNTPKIRVRATVMHSNLIWYYFETCNTRITNELHTCYMLFCHCWQFTACTTSTNPSKLSNRFLETRWQTYTYKCFIIYIQLDNRCYTKLDFKLDTNYYFSQNNGDINNSL